LRRSSDRRAGPGTSAACALPASRGPVALGAPSAARGPYGPPAMHARRTHDAYVPDNEPLWGISVYCALDDLGPGSLDGLLRRFASYRVVHLPRVGQLRRAGFPLLPSFGRPQYTVRLNGDDQATLSRLLGALGPTEPNKYHQRERPGRR
jgi:hypothetical protein